MCKDGVLSGTYHNQSCLAFVGDSKNLLGYISVCNLDVNVF